MSEEWEKPSPALKRMAEAKVPEQFRATAICPRGHFTEIECDEVCDRLVMRFDWGEVDDRREEEQRKRRETTLRSDLDAIRHDVRVLEEHLEGDS